eukprot:15331199-Ditylum_brightwellii.AAC.1
MAQITSTLSTNSFDSGGCNCSIKERHSAVQIIQRVFRGWISRYHLLRMMGVAKRRKWERRIKSMTVTRIHSDIRRKARASLRESAVKKNLVEKGRKTNFVTCCMAIAVRRVCAAHIQMWWLQNRWRLCVQKDNVDTLDEKQ